MKDDIEKLAERISQNSKYNFYSYLVGRSKSIF